LPVGKKIFAFLSTRFGLVNKIIEYLWQRCIARAALLIEKPSFIGKSFAFC